jgi:peptidoglycan/xylan/chitin deacetylase (PgdA/CDA1 family)
MYHDVFHHNVAESGFQNIGAIPYKIQSSIFENQISAIASFCESGKMNKSDVALTFDDGGESFHSIIAPILEKYGFRGYFFITTILIGTKGFLNQNQIADLHNRGHFIGAHSHTHPRNMARLSSAEIEIEWTNSVKILNKIVSGKIITASIPGGFYSEKSRIALKKNGIELIFNSIPTNKIKHNDEKQFIIGRFTIKNGTSNEAILKLMNNNQGSQFYQYAKWRGLALVRSALGNNYYRLRELILKNPN